MPKAAAARYVECEATRRSGLEGRTFMRVQGIDVVYNGSSRWAVRGGFATDRPGMCRELAKPAKHYGLLTGTGGNIRIGAWNASCAASAPWAPMSTGRDDTTRGSRGRLGAAALERRTEKLATEALTLWPWQATGQTALSFTPKRLRTRRRGQLGRSGVASHVLKTHTPTFPFASSSASSLVLQHKRSSSPVAVWTSCWGRTCVVRNCRTRQLPLSPRR